MKLRSLGLERYGRFTDRVLDFDPKARVTVIVGANEAGKTTALAAVADALYGIERTSRYNFLHDYKSMRLAATVEAPDGRSLSFARLKRLNAALVDAESNTPLHDDALAPFLGAHDRQAFLDIFGLNQRRLREGGEKLLAGGGDLAETLLAAAPGLGHVAALRDRFQESAAKIFNPARKTSSHAFHVAVDKRAQAQRAIRDQELRVDEVKKLRDEAERAAEARRAAEATERAADMALARARALVHGAKELRILDAQTRARAELGTLPVVPAGFVARARGLLSALEKAQAAAQRAGEEEAGALAALRSIAVDDAILAFAERIESADGERAAVEKELLSLPNRRAEASEAHAGLERIALALGLADVDSLRGRLPDMPLLARSEALVDRMRAAAVRSEALARDRARQAADRRAAEAARAQLGHVADPLPLQRRLAQLDGAEERERALRSLDHRLQAQRLQLGERVTRLGHGIADAEALAALPLPALGVVEAALRELKAAADLLDRQREAFATLEEQRGQAEARLASLLSGRPAPTDDAIAAARRERDAAWSALRPLALGERQRAEADPALAQAIDWGLLAADQLADERQVETQRLAELAQTRRDLADLAVRIETSGRRLDEARARREALEADWTALWVSHAPAPKPDERAVAFLREADAIRQARDAILHEAAQGAAQREAVQIERVETERLRQELGLPPLGGAPLRMADLRDAIAATEARFLEARDHERDLKQIEQGKADLALRERDGAAEAEALSAEAGEIFPRLAIRSGALAEEARAAIDLWREASRLSGELGTAERRVAGIERDEALFATRVGELLADAGDTGSDGDAFVAARRLRARLDQARQARSKADAAGEALALRQAAMAAAKEGLLRAEASVADLLAMAQCEDPSALPALLDHLDQAAICDARLAEARERLDGVRGSRGEDEIRAAIDGRDDDALALAAAEFEAAHTDARGERDAAIEQDTRAKAALAALDRRDGAAAAAQDEQDAVAEIAEAVERFSRDHVAARLLSAAIERYRSEHQNPIVERASRAFATLTGGRWSGIGIDYDQDPPRLAALREGRLFSPDALSEGTGDQLFLALRIAAIEEHARRASPLPFIADDLFITFDEARTEAGFRLLAELGAFTQVIVFTHHAHVADRAVAVLGEEAAVIEL
ncbi:ATP-binding protein [Kaistia granuli]|uniref:ATP-binding protein n=1 Tax=Kaistia granuli TaxID=363259 RepID=UPI000382C34F|nr:YhaN family protein [Kaistia granuli]